LPPRVVILNGGDRFGRKTVLELLGHFDFQTTGQIKDVLVEEPRRQHLDRADRTVQQGRSHRKARLYCASLGVLRRLAGQGGRGCKVRTLTLARSLGFKRLS
jgi:hypothetical protein